MRAYNKQSMPKNKGPRRIGRRHAFQVLYGLNFVPVKGNEGLVRAFEASLSTGFGEEEGSRGREFAWELVSGVWERTEDLDKIITRFSRHWKIQRIAKVELAILRLALFEILFCKDTPPKVAINEAVELAKRFGDENSKNFVNGILDAAAKDLEKGEMQELS